MTHDHDAPLPLPHDRQAPAPRPTPPPAGRLSSSCADAAHRTCPGITYAWDVDGAETPCTCPCHA